MNDTSPSPGLSPGATTPDPAPNASDSLDRPTPPSRKGPSRFPPAARWTLVFIVVMLALIVAIWPRGDDTGSQQADSPAATGPRATDFQVSDQELAQARREAAIEPCPATGGVSGRNAVLAGVSAPCLADGSTIDVGKATAGKPLVINIWATWCRPCRTELPHFAEFAQRAGDRVSVLGVHAQQGASSPVLVLKFLTENGIHLPSVLDTNGRVSAALGAPPVFPSTILVRPDGTVAKILPVLFRSSDEIAAAVAANLGVTV